MGDLSKNFSRWEFQCPSGKPKANTVDARLLRALQAARDEIGTTIKVTSGFRTKQYNESLSRSVPDSYHLYGQAADVLSPFVSIDQLAIALDEALGESGGIIIYENYIHVDVRPNKYRKDYRA